MDRQNTQGPGRVLALSSQVALGHVGLSAAVPVLQALGRGVTALPTILLSNHPGWPNVAGRAVAVDELQAMIDALEANGWLDDHDTLLTGYLPSAGHVALAARLIDRMRGRVPGLRVIVDPVLGDAPKGLYLDRGAAATLRDELAPRADVLTPNLFELGWLTGRTGPDGKAGEMMGETGTDPRDAQGQTLAAARTFGCRVIVTSAPAGPGRTGCLDVAGATDPAPRLLTTPLQQGVPHGVGDAFSALIAAGCEPPAALGHLQALIMSSLGTGHLRIAETAPAWLRAPPV